VNYRVSTFFLKKGISASRKWQHFVFLWNVCCPERQQLGCKRFHVPCFDFVDPVSSLQNRKKAVNIRMHSIKLLC